MEPPMASLSSRIVRLPETAECEKDHVWIVQPVRERLQRIQNTVVTDFTLFHTLARPYIVRLTIDLLD
jgi:hypothetical protein